METKYSNNDRNITGISAARHVKENCNSEHESCGDEWFERGCYGQML